VINKVRCIERNAPMKALYKAESGPGLSLVERPEPSPRDGDVKIRVMRTGICGTDLHIDSWDAWAAGAVNAPLIPGHEFSGRVVEVGADVTTVEVGECVGIAEIVEQAVVIFAKTLPV
jgi:threonine 3-dehydrogenase